MAIRVRKAEQTDAPVLLNLICALADFEQLDPPTAEAQERFQRDGWPTDGQARFSAWLAELDKAETGNWEAAGYAITFFTYSSFLAQPTFYLEDLFVLPDHRRSSVGTALMRRLVQEAWDTGCGRMEWVVLDWNTGAQEFYRRHGASHLKEWHTYRLLRDAMPLLLEPPAHTSSE